MNDIFADTNKNINEEEIELKYDKNLKNLKIEIILFFLSLLFLTLFIIFFILYIQERNKNNDCKNKETKESYYTPTQEQYIPIKENLNDDGACEYRRKLDKINSKYFKSIDIYNTKSSGSLILLEKFKTYQQTSFYSCACASLIMALYYLDGTIIGEHDCSIKAKTSQNTGTLPENLEKAIDEYGYDYESKRKGFNGDYIPSYDENKFSEYIKNSLKNKEPIILLSNDFGGHYNVIIGYDDKGTKDIEDDVVIIAEPFDTSDHINDGFTIWNFKRLYSQMRIEVLNIKNNKYEFIKIKRKS